MTGNKVDVITLGETMLMLSPPTGGLIEDSDTFNVMIGGAEANTSVGLCRLGMNSGWISKLVDNALGRKIANSLRKYGVDTSPIVWAEEGRVGLFFVEFGVEPRPLKTIYDRSNSAVTTLRPKEIDWDYLKQAKLIHQTGITPALSSECRETTIEVIKKAKKFGLKTSFDINYRSLLWTPSEARETLREILPHADILISTLDDAQIILNEKHSPNETAKKLKKEFENNIVVITLGNKGSLALSSEISRGPAYELEEVNRLGAGDAFDAGFIYGYLKEGIKSGLMYGGTMAALAHTISLNVPLLDKDDIENMIKRKITKVRR